MTARRIVFLGAAGEMCRVAIERFAASSPDWQLTLCDIRPEILGPLVERLPAGRATVEQLDLYDRKRLHDVITGAALVVLGAGPYLRTSGPVIEACLEAKVPYLDFDDDVESTEQALSRHDEARTAGIPLYIGCGASPGMTNVLVSDAAAELDTVDTIDVCWVVGDERSGVGRAVLEHLLHIAAGPCLTWEHGRPVVHDTVVETAFAPMSGDLGNTLVYETAHPEPVTLPRRYPDANRIRCLGGLDPAPLNGIARGLGLAVQNGKITVAKAVDFLEDLHNNRVGSTAGWRYAIGGMLGQIRRGESTAAAMVKFLVASALGHSYPYRGGLLARVAGTSNGAPAVAIRRTPVSGPESFLMRDMAAVTGTSCAAFMLLALDQSAQRAGTFAPEDWADPKSFYAALERLGTPHSEIAQSMR